MVDTNGSEIALPSGEAFEAAAGDIIGGWTVRSNIDAIDRCEFEVGFPDLSLLAQSEWDRITNESMPPPRQSFFLQLEAREQPSAE